MKQIIIDAQPEETRVAVVDGKRLDRLETEQAFQSPLAGNLYKGKVQNIITGLQAAFIDIGTEKNAFLYIGDGMLPPFLAPIVPNQGGKITVGQNILVQIEKDAAGQKGPKATLKFSLASRSLVLLPGSDYIGISHRIKDEAERQRLKNLAKDLLPSDMGLIIRTAAMGQTVAELSAEIHSQQKIWENILAKYRVLPAPALIYREADIAIKTIRDAFDGGIGHIVVSGRDCQRRIENWLAAVSPKMLEKLEFYEDERPIFAAYGLDDEIANLSAREIILPSGATIVIDHTEAMTVIDVNSGKFTGAGLPLEDTIYQVNIEAAAAIFHQLKLRDIGGIIIVDFIDMEDDARKNNLMEYLKKLAASDRVKTAVVDMTPLGLVEITRKKARRTYAGATLALCPICGGTGKIASPLEIGLNICREIRRSESISHAAFGYEVEVHETSLPALAKSGILTELAKSLHTKVKLTSSAAVHPSRYNIARLDDIE